MNKMLKIVKIKNEKILNNLKNSNIYTPDTNLKKEVPSFELKSFENDSIVISEKIFKDGLNFYSSRQFSYINLEAINSNNNQKAELAK